MTRFSSQALDELLGTGIRQLDITPTERSLAVARYSAVARSLAEHWDTRPHDGLVYPQGSMRLGTITRNFHRDDEIDIDLVARRDQPKESITQAELKADAGLGLEKFVLGRARGRSCARRGQALLDAALPRLPPGRAARAAQPGRAVRIGHHHHRHRGAPLAALEPDRVRGLVPRRHGEGAQGQAQGPRQAHGHRGGSGLAGEDDAAADRPGAQAAPRHLLHRRASTSGRPRSSSPRSPRAPTAAAATCTRCSTTSPTGCQASSSATGTLRRREPGRAEGELRRPVERQARARRGVLRVDRAGQGRLRRPVPCRRRTRHRDPEDGRRTRRRPCPGRQPGPVTGHRGGTGAWASSSTGSARGCLAAATASRQGASPVTTTSTATMAPARRLTLAQQALGLRSVFPDSSP